MQDSERDDANARERSMQIESAKYFIELARAGSFYGAAKGKFISHQGLNRAITSLESELGTKLVERSRRGARLTSAGEVFLKYAKRMAVDYDLLMDELTDQLYSDSETSPLSIHISYYASQTFVANPKPINELIQISSYIEEPFEKLIKRAANSDGSDLVLLDLHGNSRDKVLQNPDVVFEPFIRTRYGFAWKDGSSLERYNMLHRENICFYPTAINTFREMAQLTEWLFRDTPLRNVRMGVANPRMLLEYVASSDEDAIAAFDSFGFFRSQQDPNMPTDGLHFTPLSTPESWCEIGFLYSSRTKPSLRTRHAADVLKRSYTADCVEYFEKYPLA